MSCQLTHQAPNRTLKPLKGDKKKIRNQNKSKGNKIQIWFCVVHFVLATSRKLLNDALLLICSLSISLPPSLCAPLSRSFSKSLKMSELWQAFELHSQPIVTEASWTLPKIKRGSRKARPARRYVYIQVYIYIIYIHLLYTISIQSITNLEIAIPLPLTENMLPLWMRVATHFVW